jgi:hypothetical protein
MYETSKHIERPPRLLRPHIQRETRKIILEARFANTRVPGVLMRRRTDRRSYRLYETYALHLPAVLRPDSATAKYRIVDGNS